MLLPDKLVKAVLAEGAPPLAVHVAAAVGARGGPIHGNAEANRSAIVARSHDEVEIACLEAIADRTRGSLQRSEFGSHSPPPFEAPAIEGQRECRSK